MGGPTVTVNGLTMCHKGSKGTATSTLPDVCWTKVGKPTIPINYVNVAKDEDLVDGSETVTADGGNSIAIKGCTFSKSTGDEAGKKKGISSGTHLDEAEFISWSPDVTIEGKPVCRKTDKLLMNKGNSACLGGFQVASVKASPIEGEVILKNKMVKIYLVDDTQNPIPNEKIEIYDDKGEKITVNVDTVDENGIALIALPDVGVYYARYPDLESECQKVYVHEEKPYYPVEIKEKEAKAFLGASKGYLLYNSLKCYNDDVNKNAPNACNTNNDGSFKAGTTFYLPLRKALSGQVVIHRIYHGTKAVRCVYDDGTQTPEPLRNRYVMFWELNNKEGEEADFYTGENSSYNKFERGIANQPIGYGKTDEDGNLSSFTDISMCYDDETKKNMTFNGWDLSYRGRLSEPHQSSSPDVPREISDEPYLNELLAANLFYESKDGSNVEKFEVGQKNHPLSYEEQLIYDPYDLEHPPPKRKKHFLDIQLVPMQRRKNDKKNRVRFIWKVNQSRFSAKRKLAFMVMPADVFPHVQYRRFDTLNLLEIDEKKYIKTCKDLINTKSEAKDDQKRSFFMPKGVYKDPVEAYFQNEGIEEGYYSEKGYYYSDKVLGEKDIPYQTITLKEYKNGVTGYQRKQEKYSGGGYELITETQSNRVTIKIPVNHFLPEWTGRLKQKAELLEVAFVEYHKTIAPHVASIAKLDKMADFAAIVGRYPDHWCTPGETESISKKINQIEAMQKIIRDKYILCKKDSDPPAYTKIALENLREKADDLLELLENKGMKQAFDAFIKKVKGEEDFKGWPYEDIKRDWLEPFFSELAKAYTAFSGIQDIYEKNIYKMHVEQVFDLWASKLTQDEIDGLKTGSKKSTNYILVKPSAKSTVKYITNPILYFTDQYLELKKEGETKIPDLFDNPEGAPQFFTALANSYGMRWCHDLADDKLIKGDLIKGKAVGRMLGFLKLFMPAGKAGETSQKTVAVFRDVTKTLTKSPFMTNNQFVNRVSYHFDKVGKKMNTKCYNSFMVMFSVIGFAIDCMEDEKSTMDHWIAIAGGASGIAADETIGSGLAWVLSKHQNKSWYKTVSSSGKYLGRFAVTIGVYFSAKAAMEASKHSEFDKMVLNLIAVGGGALVLLSTGAGLGLVTLFGLPVATIGIAVSIIAVVGLFLIDALESSTRAHFDTMRKKFNAKDSVYEQEYKKVEDIVDNYKLLGKGRDWWQCSWRGVIPLYNSGSIVYKESAPGEIDVKKTSELIGTFVDTAGYTNRTFTPEFHDEINAAYEEYDRSLFNRHISIEERAKLHTEYQKLVDEVHTKFIPEIINKYENDKTRAAKGDKSALENVKKWNTGAMYIDKHPTIVRDWKLCGSSEQAKNIKPRTRYDGPPPLG